MQSFHINLSEILLILLDMGSDVVAMAYSQNHFRPLDAK
jgi:hypothetical protein